MAKPPRQTPLRWLLFADLHLGVRPSADWTQGFEELLRSFARRPPGFDTLDLVLVAGDIADTGAPAEYDRASEVFTRLLAGLPRAGDGGPPLLVTVPGNHDVTRPVGAATRSYNVLKTYHEGRGDADVADLRDELWTTRDASFIAPLFAAYTAWWRTFVAPRLSGRAELHPSVFPGDFGLRVAFSGRPTLHLVGLNSAWLAYRDGQRLALEPTQLHAALRDDPDAPLDALADVHTLLLQHHHPDLLHDRSDFDGAIYPARRFLACLHGQAPERTIIRDAIGGGEPRSWIPAYSLLGRRTCRVKNETPDRRHGYLWGELHHDGKIVVWPRRRFQPDRGERSFLPDLQVVGADEGVIARPGRDPELAPRPRPAPPRTDLPALDLTTYCQSVRAETSFIQLDGIAASREVLRCRIEHLYTRLRAHADGDTEERRGLVDLGELIPRRRRLLIEGQPGSGKTTFLRLAASVLARDFLGEPCPGHANWRTAHLAAGVAATLPVFLDMSKLAELTARSRGDVRLLDHLVARTVPPAGGAHAAENARAAWDRLLREDRVTLLLDGLDEVGDPALFDPVLKALADILRTWPNCQVVVTSRPIAADRLREELEFTHARVAPLDEADVRTYVDRWVHALFDREPEKLRGAAEADFAAGLFRTLRSGVELRRLASVPVMLTCLCVVYTHGGGLPEGRAELYERTLRWLLTARQELRGKHYTFDPWHPLAAIALGMMGPGGEGTRRELDVGRAAELVTPLLANRHFNSADPPTLHAEIVRWLDFECQYSGVIEATGRGRLRFKHLTFQEYLAAARLAGLPGRVWWPMLRLRLEDRQWRETVGFFPGCLRGDEDRDFLVREVQGLWPDQPPLLRAARITAITGRFAPAFHCAMYQLPRDLARRHTELHAEAQAIFTHEGAAKVEEKLRVAAAEALGVAGDARLAAELFEKNLLPEKGLAVRLGKYLVTVEEFARFVEDGGYQREEWWVDEEGWSFRTREGWEAPDAWEEQLGTLNRPVVGVSWFEAMAYCRWLSAEHPDWRVRLPTEAEWMAVASPDGRRYPWGDEPEPDDTRANFGKRVNAATPVGIYPAGNGGYGHADLAGNVWEWSLDVDRDVKFTERHLRDWGHPRVLCGGAYWLSAKGVAAAERYWRGSGFRFGGRGFRVAAEPASR